MLLALTVASPAAADSVTIDVSPTGLEAPCGEGHIPIHRVCTAVTNDDQNEAPEDHDACIESLDVSMTPDRPCNGW